MLRSERPHRHAPRAGAHLQVDLHPSVVLRHGLAGPRAALRDGPEVATVVRALYAESGSWSDRLAGAAGRLGLSTDQIDAAVAYYAEFRGQIDAQIAADVAFDEGSPGTGS